MRELNVNLHLRISPRLVRWAAAALCLSLLAVEVNPENITLTTYYPAPSGVYVNMVTTKQTILARDSGSVGIGTTNPGPYKVDVEGGDVSIGFMSPGTRNLFATGGAYLSNDVCVGGFSGPSCFSSANYISNAGSYFNLGNVGIGTVSPAANLDVEGTGATALTVNGGNVGIGTVSPQTKLDVEGGAVTINSGNHAMILTNGLSGCAQQTSSAVSYNTSCPPGKYATWMAGFAYAGVPGIYGQPTEDPSMYYVSGTQVLYKPFYQTAVPVTFLCCPW